MSFHLSRLKFVDGAGVLAASSILLPSRLRFGSVHVGAPMKPQELRARLRGVIAFPITPLKSDLSLDIPGLRKNLQHLLDHTVVAIVAAGGTGEMYSLTPAEHLEVIKATVEEVHEQIPVIAGTGFNWQKYGRIINIASSSSFVALFEVAAYSASKAAVASLTKSLAIE
jgi:short-subunit dehydrogenase